MIKKMLLVAVLALLAITTAPSATTNPGYLPEVVVFGPSIKTQIYTALITNHDSVSITNCGRHQTIAVKGLDSLFARIVLAQAQLETGNFKSPLAINHNNYYGMTHPRCGKATTSLGPYARAEGRSGYASYTDAEASAIDLILWLEYTGIKAARNATDYATQLKAKHYYECPVKQYISGLNHYLCR